jgi:DNA-binding GntR family transcriptional regulator
MNTSAREALAQLPSLTPLPTAAERAADLIRQSIFEGRFQPGMALPETALAQALQVSRNTVREAFRTLMGEHLLVYEVNKGVSVRRLVEADVRDIYRLRRLLELSALDLLDPKASDLDIGPLRECVAEGRKAGADGDWVAAGTANLRFHARIVALHQSPRVDELFARLMTEMRLGFLAVPDPHAFHAPYLERNAAICADLSTGRVKRARLALDAYLADALDQVVEAVNA